MKMGKKSPAMVNDKRNCEQNADLFSFQTLGTYTLFTVLLQTEFFCAVKRGSLTKINIGILCVH